MEFLKRQLREDIIRQNGHDVATHLDANQNQCPNCGIVYTFSKPRGEGEKWEREQHLGGYCSDACWPLK